MTFAESVFPMLTPKYPIYVISKGRHDVCHTANFLLEDGVDFRIVIEKPEYNLYAEKYDSDILLVLPFADLGEGSIPARNWVWEHSITEGHKRHWILDDNMRMMRRMNHGKRIRCDSKIGFRIMEDFVDRYKNIGIAGPNYTMFNTPHTIKPFRKNTHVYSCMLIDNSQDFRWRGRWNEDVDLCLRTLSRQWCIIQFVVFCVDKIQTMAMKGGNSTAYQEIDSRAGGSRLLKRRWPGVVEVVNRWGRPHFKIKDDWRLFKDIPLIKNPDAAPLKYNLTLKDFNEVDSGATENQN